MQSFFLFSLQKQAMLVRQLEEEVVKTRQQAKETNPEIKAHIEALQIENDHLTREIAILKETIRVSWEQEAHPRLSDPGFRLGRINHATLKLHFIFIRRISFQNGTGLQLEREGVLGCGIRTAWGNSLFSEVIIVRLFQELETRIETQKQTLQARDESIKKLLEMLQSKGDGE